MERSWLTHRRSWLSLQKATGEFGPGIPLVLYAHLAGLTPRSPGSLVDDLILLLAHLTHSAVSFQRGSRYMPNANRRITDCGPRGIRTLDLLNAIETRSQLRYGPKNCSRHFNPNGQNRQQVDLRGFEPLTSSVRLRRAPSCATGPLNNVD